MEKISFLVLAATISVLAPGQMARSGEHIGTTEQPIKIAPKAKSHGPDTCIQGYVWREAFTGDKVCVTPKFREQTKRDNIAAAQRVAK